MHTVPAWHEAELVDQNKPWSAITTARIAEEEVYTLWR